MHELVVIALGNPLMLGVYKDGTLIETLESHEYASESLPLMINDLMGRYSFEVLYYAKGPGSFMSIKIAYIFLKTIAIAKKIPLMATDAFYFNENQPIKALGKLCFVKTSDGISTQPFTEVPTNAFTLPTRLNRHDFNEDSAPYYGIGAVG